jgi:DNA helicase-2/ATP-dependent DNA helicase PcrA
LAAQIATSSPAVGASERARFGVVFLDEYQDTSVAQRVLLSALYAGGHPVTAVGDPCQAIYGWRGASVGNLLRFPEHFPRADGAAFEPDYLLTSFRNDGRVLRAANVLSAPLRHHDTSSRRPHVDVPELEPVADRIDAGEVRVAYHQTVQDEAVWLAEHVRAAIDDGCARNEIAVLCRRRTDFAVFHQALEEARVPVEVVGLGGLLAMPEVDEVVAWLEILADPTANPAAARILTGPRYRLGPRDLVALGRRADLLARGGQSRALLDPSVDPDGVHSLAEAASAVDPCDVVALTDAIARPGHANEYSPEAYDRILELRAEIDALRPLLRQPVVEATAGIVTAIGLDVELEVDPDGLGAARMANLAAFLDHAAHFEGLGDVNDVPAFLDYLAAAREREDGLDVGGVSKRDTVKLLTVHKAKGLEWSVVAVPCLTQDTFPSRQRRPRWTKAAQALPARLRGDCEDLPADPDYTNKALDAHGQACTEDELAEERRLAYVAVTRAKHLVLASGHAWNRTRTSACAPAEFLLEIRAACLDGAGTVEEWCEEVGDANPLLMTDNTDVAWPTAYDGAAASKRQEAAARVRAQGDTQLTLDVHQLRGEVDAVLDELARERSTERTVPLPRMLSASQIVRLGSDPAGFARSLARPMPRKPSRAARRGTLFHAWLEETLKARPLLDTEDLTGAADDDVATVASDADLASLRAAFAASPYADREAVAVEAPFALQLGGRLVRGRIDAVFGTDDGGYEVVDWKTGESGDALQLAVYRLAWAELAGVDPTRVSAAFLHIASGRVERFDDLPDREALAGLVSG